MLSVVPPIVDAKRLNNLLPADAVGQIGKRPFVLNMLLDLL